MKTHKIETADTQETFLLFFKRKKKLINMDKYFYSYKFNLIMFDYIVMEQKVKYI